MSHDELRLLYPYGLPHCAGQIKQKAQDFRVAEQLGFTLTGSGEHLFLYIQKTGLTTHQLISQIAKEIGVPDRQIGYSGLKDKQAVTSQWISIQLPGCKQIPQIHQTEQFQILQSHWHDKKLRVGSHQSNRFDIVIRHITGQCDKLTPLQHKIETSGFANYFGEQRFGVEQDNVEQALRVLNNRHKLKRLSRTKKSLYLSSLRSELFNRILSSRIAQGIWQQPLDGDAFILAGTQSIFSEALNDEIRRRYTEFDLHCGVSLYGTGESRLTRPARALEDEVTNEYPEIRDTLLNSEVKRSFRANRAIARDLKLEYRPEQAEIHLQVELDKGVYLTTLLNHFVNTGDSLNY